MDPETQEEYKQISALEHGGKITQMVIIGVGIDQYAITQALDECLVTDEEWKQPFSSFDDPFEQIMMPQI
jgi:hypothetical protein